MGRDKRNLYYKDLHQQAYEKLKSMQAFGESKKQAMIDGTEKDRIFSFSTYKTYRKHVEYFVRWIKKEHPECTTLRKAQKYANEWLESRVQTIGEDGRPLSAWTIHVEAAAINKLYGISKEDPERFISPQRKREDIRRSRLETERDRHFSEAGNRELVDFCRATGCRRNVLEKLEGRDLWSREKMKDEIFMYAYPEELGELTEKEQKHLDVMRDALENFPEQDYFIHHRQDKNGRYRFAPIIGPHKAEVIERMQNTPSHGRVWQHVSSAADIHSYRADYATAIYRSFARPIESIPWERARSNGRKFQKDLYICRRDEKGKKLDRRAMLKASKALGHNRISVVADNYIRGI